MCAAAAAESCVTLQLKVFFPEVTVAKPKSSRNSSIGKGTWLSTWCDHFSLLSNMYGSATTCSYSAVRVQNSQVF